MQDLQAYFWDEPEVNDKLAKVMHRTYDEVLAAAKEHGVSLRSAAQIIGVGRVAEAHRDTRALPLTRRARRVAVRQAW